MQVSRVGPSAGSHILIVEDDPAVISVLARYFEGEGFRISEAGNGEEMRTCLKGGDVDLVLLDLGLPGEDGLTLLREIRAVSQVGIVIVTGRGDVIDCVAGLEVGADDYVIKPFHLREILARVRSVLRRKSSAVMEERGPLVPAEYAFMFGGWRLEPARRRLCGPDGEELVLTTGEFNLLFALVTNAGRVLDRDQLINLLKGRDWAACDRSIDQQIARLRRKIELDPASPRLIKSVRGVGYLFTAEVRKGEPARLNA
ncbi:MAG: response regulator [Geminicoccaceae bacterium]